MIRFLHNMKVSTMFEKIEIESVWEVENVDYRASVDDRIV